MIRRMARLARMFFWKSAAAFIYSILSSAAHPCHPRFITSCPKTVTKHRKTDCENATDWNSVLRRTGQGTVLPFQEAIVAAVEQIMAIEGGEHGPKDRLALHPESQRYQSLIDRVFYRMAGPTDDKPPARGAACENAVTESIIRSRVDRSTSLFRKFQRQP